MVSVTSASDPGPCASASADELCQPNPARGKQGRVHVRAECRRRRYPLRPIERRTRREPVQRTRLFGSTHRVVVKARVARHRGRAFKAAPLSAHMAYLKRDGVTRGGAPGEMFDATSEHADNRAFAERCQDDRHHFRFIVFPEDTAEMEDLRAFSRDLARQMEIDLSARFDWIGVDCPSSGILGPLAA